MPCLLYTSIYNALYYTRSVEDSHGEFVDAIFHRPPPMPAKEQKETFGAILEDALGEACSFDVVEAVHDEPVSYTHLDVYKRQVFTQVLFDWEISENRFKKGTQKVFLSEFLFLFLSPFDLRNR